MCVFSLQFKKNVRFNVGDIITSDRSVNEKDTLLHIKLKDYHDKSYEFYRLEYFLFEIVEPLSFEILFVINFKIRVSVRLLFQGYCTNCTKDFIVGQPILLKKMF